MALPRTLTTERLHLQATTPAFAEAIWKAVESSLDELRPWMSWASGASFESIAGYAAGCEQRWNGATEWSFTIFEDDAVVGVISVGRYQPDRRSAEIGYWIRSDRAGLGLMTEAGEAVIGFAFRHLKLHRMQLLTAVDNLASARVAEKLGFQREGTLRQAVHADSRWHDVHAFGLVVTDR